MPALPEAAAMAGVVVAAAAAAKQWCGDMESACGEEQAVGVGTGWREGSGGDEVEARRVEAGGRGVRLLPRRAEPTSEMPGRGRPCCCLGIFRAAGEGDGRLASLTESVAPRQRYHVTWNPGRQAEAGSKSNPKILTKKKENYISLATTS
jgi:hypothetical protein